MLNSEDRLFQPQNLIPLRVSQITDSHCGPAVVQMLLAHQGVHVSQEQIAIYGGAAHTIAEHGMRFNQLALAVKRLAPNLSFWYKKYSKLQDLVFLAQHHQWPIGVEWQGYFKSFEIPENFSEDENDECGHYSIVSRIDQNRRQILIMDPYEDFINQDRIFTFEQFFPRWWDTNEITDEYTGKPYIKTDNQLLFIVTPATAVFPMSLRLRKG